MSGRLRLAGLLVAGLLASSAVAQVSQFTPGSVASSGPVTLTGDVAGTGTGTVPTTITALPLSKLATISANSLLGNNTGSPATTTALTTAQTKTLLAIANTDVSGLGTASTAATGTSGHTVPFLDGANTFSADTILSKNDPLLTLNGGGGGLGAQLLLVQVAGATMQFYASTQGYISADTLTIRDWTTRASTRATFDSTGLNLGSAMALKNNGTTILSGAGVLQAAGFPALTGDVTTSAGALGTTIAANAVSYAKMQSVTASRLLGNPTGSGAVPSEISLAGGLGFSGTTLTAAGALTPTSVASTGAISGTTIAGTSSILSSGATAGVGYATGAGGAVSQGTSRVTGVTNNKACGAITMFSAAGSATWATFTVTDSAVAATDVIVANQKSGTNLYMLAVTAVTGGTFNLSFATTGGTATDAPVINYCVVKGVAA